MAKINLLPWREEAKRKRAQQYGVHVALGIAATVVACMFYQSQVNADLEHQRARNNYLNQEIQFLQAELEEISELETTKSQLLDRMRIIQNLQTQRPQIVHTFQEVAVSLPDDLYLQSLRQNGERLMIIGQSRSNSDVSEFMRKLDASPWLERPSVQVIESGHTAGLRKFELELRQTTPSKGAEDFDPTTTEEYQALIGTGG